MTRLYRLEKEDLIPSPKAVSSVLYFCADASIITKKAQEEFFLNKLDYLCETFLHMLEPEACSSPIQIEDFIEVFGSNFSSSSSVYKASRFWKTGEIFLVTIGSALEKSVQSLAQRGEVLDALFLDAIGSAITEKAVETVQKKWKEDLEANNSLPDGYKALPDGYKDIRYSPGYCGWNMQAQEDIFNWLGKDTISVSLTAGTMMYPRKSVSGIMVLEKEDPASPLTAACRLCPDPCGKARLLVS